MNTIIYCRVSSRDQVDGTSLEVQEAACRDYARRQGLHVARVFVEQGESAKFAGRTQLLALLDFCRDKKNGVEVLLVWKVDRFARNVEDHFMIKATLRKHGVRVVSVTEPIEADPNGKLMETILAGFAQFDNDIRAMRTVQGMQQRLKEGIFPWRPPLGYVAPRIGKKTEPDRPDPRRFEPLQKAWRLVASGAYSRASVVRLLRSWGVHGPKGQLIAAQTIDQMFRNPFYVGVLRDPWTGAEYTGRHVPMVTAGEFARVQQVVNRRGQKRRRHRLNEAFPLRGAVRCPSCESLMTACFSRGQTRRYPYYYCHRHGCPDRSRSYASSAVHEEFSQFLRETSIPRHLVRAVVETLLNRSREDAADARKAAQRITGDRRRAETQMRELIAMRSGKLVSDAEFIIQRDVLRHRLTDLQAAQEPESIAGLAQGEAEELACLLSDLESFWRTAPLVQKVSFEQSLFPVGYSYSRIRTARKGLLFTAIEPFRDGESNEVPQSSANSNTLIAEIRRVLVIAGSIGQPQEQAA